MATAIGIPLILVFIGLSIWKFRKRRTSIIPPGQRPVERVAEARERANDVCFTCGSLRGAKVHGLGGFSGTHSFRAEFPVAGTDAR